MPKRLRLKSLRHRLLQSKHRRQSKHPLRKSSLRLQRAQAIFSRLLVLQPSQLVRLISWRPSRSLLLLHQRRLLRVRRKVQRTSWPQFVLKLAVLRRLQVMHLRLRSRSLK
jgi:hypothetical protein